MQEGAHQNDTASMCLERPLHYRREGKVDQVLGWKKNFSFVFTGQILKKLKQFRDILSINVKNPM